MYELRCRVRNRHGLDNLHAGLLAATVAEGARLQHCVLRDLQAADIPCGAAGDPADEPTGRLRASADAALFAADLHAHILHADILYTHILRAHL